MNDDVAHGRIEEARRLVRHLGLPELLARWQERIAYLKGREDAFDRESPSAAESRGAQRELRKCIDEIEAVIR